MKTNRFPRLHLLFSCGAAALLAVMLFIAGGQETKTVVAAALPQAQAIYCGSDDMLRHTCPLDLRGSVVELTKQKSEARCVYGSTWGFDEGGIWVDRGCRADFAVRVAPQPAPGGAVAGTIYCASDDMQRHGCPVDARGGVELVRQHSGSPCVYGRTWGYDDRGVWVDHGCRADFAVGAITWGGWGDAYNVYCASDDGGRQTCPVDTRSGVRLIRQRSGSPCVLGQTWGYGPRGIWVDRGCRGDFRVAGDWNARAGSLVYCASDDMRRNGCEVDTHDGVYLVRQRSEADCIFSQTWGFDRRGIWVDRGCRADFEIVDRRNEEWRDWEERRDRDDRPHYDDRPRN